MSIERLLVDSDSTSSPAPIIRDAISGSIAVDYTTLLSRIADSAESIATSLATLSSNSTSIKNSITAIESDIDNMSAKSTIIADKQTAMETYQKKLKELGETTGIHVVGPYDWLGLINVYRSLIEQGAITDTQGNVDASKQAQALAVVNSYIAKIQAFPTGF